MRGGERSHVMALTVVVPGDHLDVLRLLLKDFEPAPIDEEIAWGDVSKLSPRRGAQNPLGKTQFLLYVTSLPK